MKLLIVAALLLFIVQLAGCTNSTPRVKPAPVYQHGERVGGGSTSALEMPEVGTEGDEYGEEPGEEYRVSELQSEVPQAPTSAPVTEPADGPSLAGGEQVAYAGSSGSDASMGKAANSLLQKAEAQQQAGDLNGAASTLERAVGIEARNPVLWNRLANVRLQQGHNDLAVEFASKSSEFAGSDENLKHNNSQIIDMAKAAQ
ncbi:MAG: hypothetical protein ABFR19_02365 [Pseudomonadota bacterium]